MKEQIDKLLAEVTSELLTADKVEAVTALRVRFLGKKGKITELLRAMGSLSAEERPLFGQIINGARVQIEEMLDGREADIRKSLRAQQMAAEAVDVTAPVLTLDVGSLHPLTQVMDVMMDVYTGMGFEVVEGPEVELDKYNFELLNIPKGHPARDMQDSFFFSENIVLRTHTSPVQARTMLSRKPPIRIVCPGRVYRVDEVDATHSPIFHQMEGLVIDEGLTMADLKGTLDAFVQALYGEGFTTRFRPSFFPFTEPSVEVDFTCAACKGVGCSVCKGTGWIEVLGAGMVNPVVLQMCGIDPEKYSGFAFGPGIDRVACLRYSISDMRLMFENDLRFLKQFV